MLAVDPNRRFTIDQCIAHPWMNETVPNVNDSTDGLVGGVAGLAVNRRGFARERTLLSATNRVEITKIPGGANRGPIKIFSKSPGAVIGGVAAGPSTKNEPRPADNADSGAFMQHGDRGDPALYGDEGSVYSTTDVAAHKTKDKGKSKDHHRGDHHHKDKGKGKGKR